MAWRLHLMLSMFVAAAATGCLGSALTGGNGGGGGSGGHVSDAGVPTGGGGNGGSGGGVVDMAPDVVSAFYATVAPIIRPSCGGCHGVAGGSGPAFMMDKPDLLQNLLVYPGIVGFTPESSRLYEKGAHEGPAFTPDQAKAVHDWIVFFNSVRPTDGGVSRPSVSPFAPAMGATNTVDLSAFDISLVGQKVTFTAKMVGSSIELSDIKVVTTASMGVHVAHPLFVMWDQNLKPTPDPIDSFSNVDETVPSGSSMPLGPGTLIMPSFPSGGLLNVVFTTVEAKNTTTDGGTTGGCKNVMSFTTNVVPQINGSQGLLNCAGCHGQQGNNAANVWNIVNVGNAAAPACASTLGEIMTATPAMSTLFKKVDPNSGTPHQGGKLQAGQVAGFESAITTWINAEK